MEHKKHKNMITIHYGNKLDYNLVLDKVEIVRRINSQMPEFTVDQIDQLLSIYIDIINTEVNNKHLSCNIKEYEDELLKKIEEKLDKLLEEKKIEEIKMSISKKIGSIDIDVFEL